MYKQAFQEAAGATKDKNGKMYGGIIEYRGNRISIPSNIPQDRFSDIIRKATYDDFVAASNGTPADDTGRAYTIDRLRKGYPVSDASGTAFWSFDNPKEKAGGTLIAFYTKDGSPLKVDLRVLGERVKAREGIK